MSSTSTIEITLQGRQYRVACPPDERAALLAAVAHVEAKMHEIATRTRGSGERLAVMTALNLAHELLGRTPAAHLTDALHTSPATTFDNPEFGRRIDSMVARMDAMMAQQESLL